MSQNAQRDAAGTPLDRKERFIPKDFRQSRFEGGRWVPGLESVRRVPYGLPELLKSRWVFVVEGEKDADRLASIGLPATTNDGGPGNGEADGELLRFRPALPPDLLAEARASKPELLQLVRAGEGCWRPWLCGGWVN